MATQATARQKETEAEERNENGRSNRPVANESLNHQASTNDVTPQGADRYIPMRAKLVCTEITHTQRGVVVLRLDAKHDGNIKKEEALVAGNSPVGTCTIEVSDDWAGKNAVHGSIFYLMSTNQKQ